MPKKEVIIRAGNTKVNKDHNLIQKKIFLLKHLGIEPFTRYDFSLYLHGPYSPSLAQEYNDTNTGVVATIQPELSDDIAAKLDWFMKHDDDWLEIATSILDIEDSNILISATDTFETIQMSKPWVSKECFNSILKEIRDNGL